MNNYNTRRGNFGAGAGNANANNSANLGGVGSRRPPVVTNNFVPGGQLAPQKTGVQQSQGQQQSLRTPSQPSVNFRNTQPNISFQQKAAQATPQPQPTQPPLQQTQPPQQQTQPQPQQQLQQQSKELKQEQHENAVLVAGNGEETGEEPKKKFWNRGNKLSKKEKQRRRNLRLSKILQPKNALMILNELVKNPTFVVTDINSSTEGNLYKATVVADGIEHVGTGKSKVLSKSNAAEVALRYLIKNKKVGPMTKFTEEGGEMMETGEEEDDNSPLPWQHVASFALFKLFCSWGENPNVTCKEEPKEAKAAKKLPANALEMNPLMLANQMLPHGQYEELPRLGTPPNVTFSFRYSVNGQSFIGSGTTKKSAKKMAAFAACNKILEITYPPEVYTPA